MSIKSIEIRSKFEKIRNLSVCIKSHQNLLSQKSRWSEIIAEKDHSEKVDKSDKRNIEKSQEWNSQLNGEPKQSSRDNITDDSQENADSGEQEDQRIPNFSNEGGNSLAFICY